MMNDLESKEVVVSKKLKQKRPDGFDVGRYRNLKNWSYRQWAWEFLRRNVDFIEACKKVSSDTDEEKMSVAQKFGLKKFKKYTESYKGVSGYPIFSTGSITSFSNLDCDKNSIRRKKIAIKAGQVVIRFDLASATKDIRVLEKQLRMAKKKLIKARDRYAEKMNDKPQILCKPKSVNFGIYLRLLDHLAGGKTPVECARLIHQNKVKERYTDDQLRQLVKDQITSAKEYADKKYLDLSLLDKKSKGKKIMLGR